ncbi:MAG: TetR/AcrR family transcriptional regulator [Oscillospiraceae bacterium]
MGSNIKAVGFLKECMSDALLKLMGEKDFSQITINEISQRAGVNRSTWFRNFTSKEDAITYKYIRLWEHWADEHSISERNNFTLDNAQDFFEFNYSIRHIHRIVYSAELQSALFDAFYRVMTPQFGANAAECYQSRFYSYGLFGFLDEWIKRGFYENPEEMTELFLDMIKNRQ